ncbi:myotubularin-related dual specificity phosphatase [Scheffersomyces xylosifermentans]|uniref:myotubularin-related dual specificity phosphatase n=1 Tax=Scheffersomyces xylosifermentans TaxID=1304137 RepID=UPI00315DCA04
MCFFSEVVIISVGLFHSVVCSVLGFSAPSLQIDMEPQKIFSVKDVILNRRGYCITGTVHLSQYHLVFSFVANTAPSTTNNGNGSTTSSTNATSAPPAPASTPAPVTREIWIAYPVIDRISKSRGSSWIYNSNTNNSIITSSGTNGGSKEFVERSPPPQSSINSQNQSGQLSQSHNDDYDHYTASHIRLQCKDFTYYSFDFVNDLVCTEVFAKLSSLITVSRTENDIRSMYAYDYRPNYLEQKLELKGWDIYDPIEEYKRQGLLTENEDYWRLTNVNEDYKFCPSYPNFLVIPSTISDNVLKHAAKFRSKQRIPAIVYRHRGGVNGNVIARCSQPLVGLNLQNRSIQDEKLIGEIFRSQQRERSDTLPEDNEFQSQPQRNLLVDLRPITNAMAQHALGAGTENIDNYRGKAPKSSSNNSNIEATEPDAPPEPVTLRQVNKIFCNIDNIHVMRESLNKLNAILNDLDRFPVSSNAQKAQSSYPLLQQLLTKTQWLHRLSIILQSVDRISKSIHLNNTNVVIHCSDGWDRTSQVSALSQLCLDPYYRTMKGFMVLIEKEWVSFGFKFATRGDHGGCIGAIIKKEPKQTSTPSSEPSKGYSSETSSENSEIVEVTTASNGISGKSVASFLQRAANHIKNTATTSPYSPLNSDTENGENGKYVPNSSVYNGSSEKSPIFHQFLDCVYQIHRQHPSKFEFNTRFLKRLFYHYYSCQYGSFLCDTERELKIVNRAPESTVSVWDYFNSRPMEFANKSYNGGEQPDDGVIFFNFADVKWWSELYGRSDEEMNGLSNSLDRKFAQMKLNLANNNSNNVTGGASSNSNSKNASPETKP